MPLAPVDHDPFAAGAKLIPVEGNPFALPKRAGRNVNADIEAGLGPVLAPAFRGFTKHVAGPVALGSIQAAEDVTAAGARALGFAGQALPFVSGQPAHNIADEINRANAKIDQDQPLGPGIVSDVQGAARSLVPAVVAGRVGGTPGVIGFNAFSAGQQAYTRGKDAGLKDSDAVKYALTTGAIEGGITAAFQRFMPGLESTIAGKTTYKSLFNAVKGHIRATAQEIPEEGAIGYAQAFTDWWFGVDPNALSAESRNQMARSVMGQTAVMGAATSPVQLGAAAAEGLRRKERLAQLQEIRSKGFISTEDGQAAGIPGETRKERRANADAEIKQLEKEIQNEVQEQVPEGQPPEKQAEVPAAEPAQTDAPHEVLRTPELRDYLEEALAAAPEEALPRVSPPIGGGDPASIKAAQEAAAARAVNENRNAPITPEDAIDLAPPSAPETPEIAENAEKGPLKNPTMGLSEPRDVAGEIRDAIAEAKGPVKVVTPQVKSGFKVREVLEDGRVKTSRGKALKPDETWEVIKPVPSAPETPEVAPKLTVNEQISRMPNPSLAERLGIEQPKAAQPEPTDEDLATMLPEGQAEYEAQMRGQKTPDVQLAGEVSNALAAAETIDAKRLHSMAEKAYGGTRATGAYDPSRANDAMELGINLHVTKSEGYQPPSADAEQAKSTIKTLEEVIKRTPSHTNRSGLKDVAQQFSTPPAYAYAVNWIANIGKGDAVLEPSAGTGSIAVHAKQTGAKVYVNELKEVGGKPNRRATLLNEIGADQVFTEDAEQIGNVLAGKIKPTVVVMNPPFSTAAGRMEGKKIQGTDLKHIEAALELLEPNGRLVAIIGAGLHGKSKSLQDWENSLPYDLRADIELAREVYRGYGTTFPTRVLVIDKTAPTGKTLHGKADTLYDLIDQLEGIRNDRTRTQPNPTRAEGEGATRQGGTKPRSEPAVRAPSRPVVPAGEEAVDSGTTGEEARPPDAGTRKSASRPAAAKGQQAVPEPGLPEAGRPEPGGEPDPARKPSDRGTTGTEVGGEPVREPSKPDPRPEPGPRLSLEDVAPKTRKKELTESVYETYQPRRVTVKGSKPHPASVVESAAMAAVDPPKADYTPSLPEKAIESGALSDIQLEAIIYAGHAHGQQIEIEGTKYRKGFLIGDGTGIGKGRTAAGIILDNVRQGRRKAVWVSKNYGLLVDSKEYSEAVGLPADKLFSHQKTASGSPFEAKDGVLFTTYETMRGTPSAKALAEGNQKSRLDQVVDWLGEDFDGVIIFDEAHLMGNAVDTKGGRGTKKASARALAGVELQRRLPQARIVYMSATAATEVSNLAYAERLGLWGKGTAFANQAEFETEITKGGVAAMEKVAGDMKAMGLYVSRNISFNDGTPKGTVEYERLEHTLTPAEEAAYGKMAEAWGIVFKNMNEALQLTDGAKNGRAVSAARGAFWGASQRFWNQVITAMQTPAVIKAIEKDLEAGHSAVVQLTNTNEAATQRALSELDGEEGYEEIDTSPRGVLMDFVEKSFPVWEYEEYTDDSGNIRTRPAVDANGNKIKNAAAVRMQEQLLDELGSLQVGSRGAIDMMIDHFGADQVAEITGRTMRLVKNKDGKLEKEGRSPSKNKADIKSFQDGRKRILVFSEAGGTGASYHADLNRKNQQMRRHYLLQAGWRADVAIQGFGRSHRSNQAQAPGYVLVHTNLKGQKRFISTIARRLAQLGAITKGQRQAVSGGEKALFTAADNLESTEAHQALVRFYQDVRAGSIPSITMADMQERLGLQLVDENGNLRNDLPPITQFLNRVLSLPVKEQNAVFGEFESRLTEQVEMAQARGELDQGIETIRADRITKLEDRPVYTHESGAETRYVKVNIARKTKPMTWGKLQDQRGIGAEVFYVRSKKTGKLMAVIPTGSSEIDSKTGDLLRKAKVFTPLGHTYGYVEKLQNEKHYDDVGLREAEGEWNAAVKAAPEFHETEEHFLSGVLLPIWNRIPGENARVMRMLTDEGETILGRQVPGDQVQRMLRALGVSAETPKLTPAEAARQVMDRNVELTLANDWKIQRRLVGGENRMELIGPSFQHHGELGAAGVFWERIQSRTRYFIPTDRAAEVLADVLEGRPISDVVGRETTKLQEAADEAVQEALDAEDELAKHLKGKSFSGVDPQAALLAGKVVYKWAKAGYRKFRVLLEQLVQKLGQAKVDAMESVLAAEWDRVYASGEFPDMEPRFTRVDPDDTTGPKNAKTDELRRQVGMEERPPVSEETVEEWQAKAAKRMATDPDYARELSEQLADKPRAIDELEQAVLGRYLRDLKNRHNAGEDVADELRTAIEADERVGTIWGRAGASRQVELAADFSIVGIVRQHFSSVNKAPTDAEMETYSEKADQIAKHEEEAKDLQQQRANEAVDAAIAEASKPTPAPKAGRRKAAEKRIDAAWEKFRQTMAVPSANAAAQLSAAVEVAAAYWELGVVRFQEFMEDVRKNVKDPDEKLFREAWKQATPSSDINDRAAIGALARQLTRAVVESGITEREAVIDAVHEELTNMGFDIIRPDTMAAMSGYGDFRELSKDEVSVKVRGIKGEIQQLLKLQDMQSGEAPKKSGVERRVPTDEERRLIKLVNEAKKKGGYTVTDPERQLKSALSTAKTAARNRIADLEQAIAKRERIVAGQTKLKPDAELAALQRQRDQLNEEYRKIFPPKKNGLSDAARLKLTERMLDRQITELKADLAAGNLDPKAKGQPLSSPAIEAKKLQLELLKTAREQARAASPEYQAKEAAKQNARYKKSLDKLLALWQARLTEAEQGIAPKKRKETPLDKAILEKKFQIEQVKRETRALIEEAERAARSRTGKVLGFGGDLLDLSQAIMTGYEMSAVLRQGAFYTYGFPRKAYQAIKNSVRAAISRRADFAIHEDLKKRANHLDYMQGGLETTADDGPLSHREELIRSRLASWLAKQRGAAWALPRWAAEGLLGGERAFRTFANTMRADLFDYMKASVEAARPGTWSEDDAKVLGSASNVFSGRGELPAGWSGVGGSRFFFAPRWVWSRGQLLVGQPLWRGDSATRLAVGKVYVRAALGFAAFQLTMHVLYSVLAGDDDDEPTYEWDPRSSDFNKRRVGDTRIDSGAGLNQLVVLLARVRTGETKQASGKIVPIRGEDVPPGADDTRDVVHRFLDSKLAPLPSAVMDWIAGENVVGEKATVGSIVGERVSPMTWRDIWKAEKELNVPQGTVAAIEAFFGEGVTTYGQRTKFRNADAAGRQQIIEKDLKYLSLDSPDPAYSEFLTPEQLQAFEDRRRQKQGLVVYNAMYSGDNKEEHATRDKNRGYLEEMRASGMTHEQAQELLEAHYRQPREGKMQSELQKGGGGFDPGYLSRALALAEWFGKEDPRQAVRDYRESEQFKARWEAFRSAAR